MTRAALVTDEESLAAIVRDARTVAVVGMKDESTRHVPAFEVPQVLQQRGLRVIPVNPHIQSALGETAYADLASVPDRFDVVNVFRRAEKVPAHADEILALPEERRPDVVWMQSGIVSEAAADALRAAGIRVVMDRCLGVYASRYRR